MIGACGCTAWPRCGHDGSFAPTQPPPAMRPTTPLPPPDRVAAWRRAVADCVAAGDRAAALWSQMTAEERAQTEELD